jgi:hypothetical protein
MDRSVDAGEHASQRNTPDSTEKHMNPFSGENKSFVFYYPTLRKSVLSGGGLNTEYKDGKAMQGSDFKVTKTPDKLAAHIRSGATDVIVIGHGAAGSDKGNARTVAGGSWLYTPKKDATDIGLVLSRRLGPSVRRVWVWVCQSSANGVGIAIKGALQEDFPAVEVYATPDDIGSPFYYLNQVHGFDRAAGRANAAKVNADSFRLVTL